MEQDRPDLGAALSLLARQTRPDGRRRLLRAVLLALWLVTAAWSVHLVVTQPRDAGDASGLGYQLALLIVAGLVAPGTMALMLLRSRRTADQLNVTARGLRKIIETAQDVIWVVNAEGRKVFVNEAARTVYGYAPEELIGRPAMDLLAPENRERDLAAMGRALGGENVFNYEATVVRRDGTRIPVLYNASALRDPSGRVIGCMGTAYDISKLKSMQERLLRNERQQALGTLASGVVHDFNNLLTVILGQTERAREDEGLPEKVAQRLAAIQETAERANRLVARLLVFTDSATSNRTRIDLAAAVLRMESFLADLLGDRGTLTITTMDAPVHVSADWGQIEQIVMNLVLNARDAIADDGQVHIRVRRDAVAHARAAELDIAAGDWACLEVKDNGVGMDGETRARIFEPFFTTKASGHGTGLGLAGVQGIVQQHQGSIHVVSRPGAGTSMTVHLPLMSESVPVSS